MARKESKEPQYLPLIAKARLHTGGREYEKLRQELKGQGFTCNQMKCMVREGNYLDGLVVIVSKWNWDNHESWHLYTWGEEVDEKVMLAMYQAEQYHPYAPARYRNDFEKFKEDWKNETYDPGMTYTFKEEEVEVLEVLQEEVDNINHEDVKRQVQQAYDAEMRKKHQKKRARRNTQSRGSRYHKKYY